jgi:hypothetical protein
MQILRQLNILVKLGSEEELLPYYHFAAIDFPWSLDVGPNRPKNGDNSAEQFQYLQYGRLVAYEKESKD